MTDPSRAFFQKLLETPGASGYESAAQAVWREYVVPFADEIEDDAQGSVVAAKKGASSDAVMLVGHIDEIGLIVKHVEGNGFLKVASVGGIRPAWMPSQRVRIVGRSGIVHGVVGTLSSDNKDPKMEDLFIDIGAKDKEDALKWVELGDPIVVGHDWQELDNGLVTARNFDNRVGCYIVAEVMRRLSERESVPVTVLGVSATQEETGGIGAGQVANRWKPTVGIAFDVTWASDYPSTNQALIGDVKLGGGPVLIRGVRTSQRLYEQLRATAERHDIPWQVETETGRTSTDADSISTQHGGIPVTVISIPTRYMHSSCEVISLNDVEQIIDLTVAYLTEYGTA